jgi:hypothetical protein
MLYRIQDTGIQYIVWCYGIVCDTVCLYMIVEQAGMGEFDWGYRGLEQIP